jgi:two-component system, LytTR family, response regulator
VHSEYKLVKIQLNEIEYIESLEDYIKIHITGSKPVLTLLSMKKVLEKLPAEKFQRIHRSYIVSVAKVKSIQNRKVQLSAGAELPISDSYVNFINSWKKN